MPVVTGMKGGGFYDQHSGAQLSAMRALQGWIDNTVANLPLPSPPRPVVVLDLGSSEGRNAIHLMESIVASLRRSTDQAVQTIYSDLVSNNFNRLFANLEEARRAGRFDEGVYTSAVGGSFYGPLLPPETVHFAISLNALNWLDRMPSVPVTDFVCYQRPLATQAVPASSQEVTAAFKRQAEKDLLRFLQCRARELVPGAKLLIAAPGDTDQTRMCDGIWNALNDACLDLIAEGWLEREEYKRLTMPTYCRTVDEFLAPMEEEDSPVRDAFTVDQAEAMEIPPPLVAQFRRDGNVAAYADAFTGFMRAVSEPVVRLALNRPGKQDETVNRLYEQIRARLFAEPDRYEWHYTLVAVLLTRL